MCSSSSTSDELIFTNLVPGDVLSHLYYDFRSLIIGRDSIDFNLSQTEEPKFVEYIHFTLLTTTVLTSKDKDKKSFSTIEETWYRADDQIRIYDLFVHRLSIINPT